MVAQEGGLKFMYRKSDSIGSTSKNTSELIPEIRHFIECISNVFYSFKENNKEFSCVSLSIPIRIKRIPSVVSLESRSYKNLDKNNMSESDMITFKKSH